MQALRSTGSQTIASLGSRKHAAFDMTRHLIARGHRTIGFIKGNPAHASTASRRAGFVAAAPAAGLGAVDTPLAFPQPVEIGLAVGRLGGSSVTYHPGVFARGADSPAAKGHFTHVTVGRESRRPTPLPTEWRDKLERLI